MKSIVRKAIFSLFFVNVKFFCMQLQPLITKENLVSDCNQNILKEIDSLYVALQFAATCKQFYADFYTVIKQPTILFLSDPNFINCTRMLASCACFYQKAHETLQEPSTPQDQKQLHTIEKKKYKDRFNMLWQHAAEKRNQLLLQIIGDGPKYAIDSKCKIQAYAGIFPNYDLTQKALSLFLENKEWPLLEILVKNNLAYLNNLKKCPILENIYDSLTDGKLVQQLINDGLCITSTNGSCENSIGKKLICIADKKQDLEMIQFLLDKGVKHTHYHYTRTVHDYENTLSASTIKLLLKHDYFDQKTKNSMLNFAAIHNKKDISALLLTHGANPEQMSLDALCRQGLVQEVKSRLKKDPDLLSADRFNWCNPYPLAPTIQSGNLDLLELIAQHAGTHINDIFYFDRGYDGPCRIDTSALYEMIQRKEWKAAEILVHYGGEVKITSDKLVKEYIKTKDPDIIAFQEKHRNYDSSSIKRFQCRCHRCPSSLSEDAVKSKQLTPTLNPNPPTPNLKTDSSKTNLSFTETTSKDTKIQTTSRYYSFGKPSEYPLLGLLFINVLVVLYTIYDCYNSNKISDANNTSY